MSNRQKIGVACFLAAAVLAVFGTRNTFFADDAISVTNSSGLGVSQMVGAYLPMLVMLIIGAWFFQKPK